MLNLCVFYRQELRDLVRRHSRARVRPVAVHKDWLEACFSQQRQVDTAPFLHQLR